MKKKLTTVIILLFTVTAVGYAQIFREQENSNESPGTTGSVEASVNGTSVDTSPATSDDYGGFFRASDADVPGGRPGNGGGIGQRAPISDGLPVLIVCCAVLIIVKSFNSKGKKR